jgi:ammonium transporter, Amt family
MAPGVDAGDTAWMLAATALVLLMTPALGLFYAGLVRSKNTLNTFMMCVAALAVATITWALIGYSFAFSEGNGFIGGFGHAFLSDVAFAPRDGTKIPHLLFMAFQATFCIVTTALVAGAVVERMRFAPFLIFAALWSVLVYGVLAHWAFGGGWLQAQGTLDFAGGVPVEMGSGSPRSPRRWWSARAATGGARPSCRTTRCSCCSARGCCGSGGSVSTAGPGSAPGTPACSRS